MSDRPDAALSQTSAGEKVISTDQGAILMDEEVILVDFKNSGGSVAQVSRTMKPEEITQQMVQQSQRALSAAMGTIRVMGNRTIAAIDTMTNKPSTVEVEFGIKLDAKAGALLTSAGAEGNIKVKLVWNRQEQKEQTEPAPKDANH